MGYWIYLIAAFVVLFMAFFIREIARVRRVRKALSKAHEYPKSPCGNDKDHYEWEEVGWSCPHCAAIKLANDEFQQRQKDINDLADAVAKRIKEWEGQR